MNSKLLCDAQHERSLRTKQKNGIMWDLTFRQQISMLFLWAVTPCEHPVRYQKKNRLSRPKDGDGLFVRTVEIYLHVHTELQSGTPTSTKLGNRKLKAPDDGRTHYLIFFNLSVIKVWDQFEQFQTDYDSALLSPEYKSKISFRNVVVVLNT
jgi:hypothetical protein